MNCFFSFFLLLLMLIPNEAFAAGSILEPVYHVMEILSSHDPPSTNKMFQYQYNNDIEAPFQRKLKDENGTYLFVTKYDKFYDRPAIVDQQNLWNYIYDHRERFPSLAAIWLRNKVGNATTVQMKSASLQLNATTPTNGLQLHQPLCVNLIVNEHRIVLRINWQTEPEVGFPLAVLELHTIDGDYLYDAAVHDAETMCVKCWFE